MRNAKTLEPRNAKTRSQAWTCAVAGFSVFALGRFSLADQPSLDDLLDLTPPPAESIPTPPAPERADVQIDPQVARRLQGINPADVLEQAVADMDTVSQRLGRDRDAGVQTQRQQEEILAKLDRVIEAAKQQQQSSSGQGGGSSSGGSQSSQPDAQQSGSAQNQGPNQQQPGHADNQGQDDRQKPGTRDGQESSPGVRSPSDPRQGDASQPLDEQRSEWGNLPPRLRDQLLEGTREKFSPVYRDLTEQYYKRLAEEGR